MTPVYRPLATPGIVSPLYSETHPEGRIGYREWVRGNGRLGDIYSVDDRYDHDVDELMAQPRKLTERTGRRMYFLPRSPLLELAEANSRMVRGWVVENQPSCVWVCTSRRKNRSNFANASIHRLSCS
jgi:hypothetical protein